MQDIDARARGWASPPPSATAMVKKLASLGLADHQPYRGVRLTRARRACSRSRCSATTACSSSTWRKTLELGLARSPRRGRPARARAVRGARGAHRRGARLADAGPARRPDPRARRSGSSIRRRGASAEAPCPAIGQLCRRSPTLTASSSSVPRAARARTKASRSARAGRAVRPAHGAPAAASPSQRQLYAARRSASY